MKNTTLLFLIKKSGGEVTDICLAMKKRGLGVGRWNGVGGKVTEGESIEDAVLRETKEEIGVTAKNIHKVAEISFAFSDNHPWNQLCHTYLCETWEGEPSESEEMKPRWFKVSDIPYSSMWPDDIFWLPKVISGQLLKASFAFGEGDVMLEQKIEEVLYF